MAVCLAINSVAHSMAFYAPICSCIALPAKNYCTSAVRSRGLEILSRRPSGPSPSHHFITPFPLYPPTRARIIHKVLGRFKLASTCDTDRVVIGVGSRAANVTGTSPGTLWHYAVLKTRIMPSTVLA